MTQLILATAIELRRVHGVQLAARYLFEAGISLEIAREILACSTDSSPWRSKLQLRPTDKLHRKIKIY